jgi:UDP-N-acetylglucosamine 4,6-dehydratase/5-epimerase
MSQDQQPDPGLFDILEGRTVILTGATGSFGRHISRALSQATGIKRLLFFSRDEERQRLLRLMLEPLEQKIDSVEYVIGDVRDRDSLFRVAASADLIINAAALKQVPACELNALEAIRTNVMGMQNILDAAAERGVRDVLTISTDKAVQPINTMGISKAMQERVVQSHALRWEAPMVKVVRYGNVLGSTGSVLPVFLSQLEKTGRITVTDPDMTRFLLTLNDAMHLVHRALIGSEPTGTTYVRRSPATTVQDVAAAILRVFSDGDLDRIDVVGPRPGDKFHEVLVSEDEMRRAELADGYYVVNAVVPTDKPSGVVSADHGPREPFTSDRAERIPPETLDKLVEDWSGGSPAAAY